MKPPVFDYAAPGSVSEVLDFLADESRDVKILAGGQSLIPMLNMRLARPEVLVDITRIAELGVVEVDKQGNLRVGACVRQAEIARMPAVRRGWPLLASAIGHIGHPQIRSRGTVCGSLVHHDPAAELPTAAVALGANFVIATRGGVRTVGAEEFFVGTFQTAVEPHELLIEVVFPPKPNTSWAFCELARRHGDFAMIGVAIGLTHSNGVVDSARVVLCGAGSTPIRVPRAEDELCGGEFNATRLSAARQAVLEELDPPADIHATSEYRRDGAAALLERALNEAWEKRNVL